MSLKNESGKRPAAIERIRADVRAMQAYRVADASGMVKLDAMENPYTLPVELRAALGLRLAAVTCNRYPAEEPLQLAEALHQHLALPAHCRVLLGNGSDEWISLLALACSTVLDQASGGAGARTQPATILAPQPSFVMYPMSARLQGLRYVGVDLNPDFSLNVPAMMQALEERQAALIFLASPNNPCGSLWDADAVQAIVAAAAQQGSLVVIDEAYAPFAPRSWVAHIGQSGWEHVLLLRTFSKLGLAGARIGYLAGLSVLLNELDKVRPPYNLSSLAATTGLFALEHQAVFAAQAEAVGQERARVVAALRALFSAHADARVFDSSANMFLLRLPASHPADAVFEALRTRGILVKNVSHSHPLLQQCLRITVGTADENTRVLDALQTISVIAGLQ